MRHVIWLLGFALTLGATSVWADAVGSATLVIGSPQVETNSGSVALHKGDGITVGSRVTTGRGDHAHIRFVDGTLVSVRPNTVLSIELFAGNAEQVESFRLNLDQGVIRTISGDGLKSNRDGFRLNTPIAAIGIRGTDFTTQANLAETQIRVHAGEVVMSPLGGSCVAGGLGPCVSEASLSLAAGTNDTLRMRAGGLPELFRSTIDPALESTDPSASDGSGEVEAGEASVTASRVRADGELVSFKERPELRPFDDTETDLANQAGPLIWGHWFAKPRGDDWSIPAAELIGQYDPTVSNRYHGLFRDPVHSGVVNPSQAKVVLGLTAADATLDYEFLQTPATVTAGYLLFDFEARAFMSELTVNTDRLGSVDLTGIGFISPTGVFVSRSNSDRMAGAMTSDGLNAGMLFEKQVEGGLIQGVSLWGE